MTAEWSSILQAQDLAVLMLFAGVCAFVLNWYLFPRAQRIMAWLAFVLATGLVLWMLMGR